MPLAPEDEAGAAILGAAAKGNNKKLIPKIPIDTPRAVLIDVINKLIEQFNLGQGVIGTDRLAHSIVMSEFTPTAVRYSKTSAGWGAITNASMTYKAGKTKEKLYLTIGAMAAKQTAGNGEISLYVDGVAYGIRLYYTAGILWYRGQADQPPLELEAEQEVTLALYAYNNDANAFDVTTEQSYWLPTISGFAVFNGLPD